MAMASQGRPYCMYKVAHHVSCDSDLFVIPVCVGGGMEEEEEESGL